MLRPMPQRENETSTQTHVYVPPGARIPASDRGGAETLAVKSQTIFIEVAQAEQEDQCASEGGKLQAASQAGRGVNLLSDAGR